MTFYCLSIKNLPAVWMPDSQDAEFWLINTENNTRQPITERAIKHHNVIISPENTHVDIIWSQAQRDYVVQCARVPEIFDIEPSQVHVLEPVREPVVDPEPVPVAVPEPVPVPVVAPEPVPVPVVVPEPVPVPVVVPELVPVPVVAPEPVQVPVVVPEPEPVPVPVVVPEPVLKNEPEPKMQIEFNPIIEPPPPTPVTTHGKKSDIKSCSTVNTMVNGMIPDISAVTGSVNDGTPEKELYDEITNGIRKLRNRCLKIDVLMNDLLDLKNQGFDVSAAFEPLEYQKENLLNFETEIMDNLRKIIKLCDDKMNTFRN